MLQVSLMDIACPTQRLCYAVGSGKGGPNGFGGATILVTADGGRSWHPQSNPLSRRWNAVPQTIACATAQICYVAGSAATILATVDGGRTWRSQRNPLSGTYRIIYGIACSSITTCYAVGDRTRILATSNGGRTWHDQPSPLKADAYPRDVACPGAAICYIVGGGYDMSGQTHSTIIATMNGGRSWRHQRSGTTNALWSIACPTISVCYAVGAAGTMLFTGNGGKAWTLQNSPPTALDFLSDIACPSTKICYAVGGVRHAFYRTRYVILATKSGGATWTFQKAPLGRTTNYTYQYGIACPATSTCYVVGGPRLVATTDGGRTWHRLSVRRKEGQCGGTPAV
jgi:photosystem II stability/assembly factor-like uncharacterized protein